MPTAKEYAQAIEEANGLVSVAARHLGVSRRAIYDAKEKYASVKEAFDAARERTVDTAESKLFSKVEDGDVTSIIFLLKTLGKSRGYIERQELDANVKGNIVIDLVTLPNASDD